MAGRREPSVDPVAMPVLSVVLGFGSTLPVLVAGVGALSWEGPLRAVAIVSGTGWAAAILIFIAGVRRGYGFAVNAQPRVATMLATFAIFFAGVFAIPLFLLSPLVAILVLAIGYVGAAILDTAAAHAGDAPRHFARLRPPQMASGLLGLALLGAACIP
jgi:hypothetical protein